MSDQSMLPWPIRVYQKCLTCIEKGASIGQLLSGLQLVLHSRCIYDSDDYTVAGDRQPRSTISTRLTGVSNIMDILLVSLLAYVHYIHIYIYILCTVYTRYVPARRRRSRRRFKSTAGVLDLAARGFLILTTVPYTLHSCTCIQFQYW